MKPLALPETRPIAVLWWLLATVYPVTPVTVFAVPVGDLVDQPKLTKALKGVSRTRMLADVAHLSGPDFNGRQTGTADDLGSSLFVAERFKSLGLHPAGTEVLGPGVQAWAMTETVKATQVGKQPHLGFTSGSTAIVAHLGTDYLPVLDSSSVNVTAPVVFVGYGISDPARGFDEYAGLDVRKSIVLFFRGKPERYAAPVTHADKERGAREKGAVAFLTLTGPIMSAYESRRGIGGGPMAYYGHTDGEQSLPGCWISTAQAETIFSAQGHSLREIQEQLNRALAPQSATTGIQARLAWDSTQTLGTLVNIIGIIPGAGNETVVIGAHRDHFGRQAGLLFPGADDNASGTAVLLEVARVLLDSKLIPKRTILFASFSGEEQGLLGSKLYVRRPSRPLGNTVAMINVDHAGIGNGRLTVGVTGLPKSVATEAGQLAGLADQLDLFGFFPGGDHVPFKEAGIPTIAIVSAGAHPHFHQPTDTAETVQPEILQAVARYVLALTWQLANDP